MSLPSSFCPSFNMIKQSLSAAELTPWGEINCGGVGHVNVSVMFLILLGPVRSVIKWARNPSAHHIADANWHKGISLWSWRDKPYVASTRLISVHRKKTNSSKYWILPEVLVAWSDRANLHLKDKQFQEAIACYEFLLEKLPGSVQLNEALETAKKQLQIGN